MKVLSIVFLFIVHHDTKIPFVCDNKHVTYLKSEEYIVDDDCKSFWGILGVNSQSLV